MCKVKCVMNKKTQLYGISAFMYALAIAVVLIIGMLGLSKDIETSSQAGLYRYNSLSAVKASEVINKILDEDRGYAVDKSLFITSAFGGYKVNDFICNSTTHCNADGRCDIPIGSDQSPCYPNIKSSSGFGCGIRETNVSFLGEKQVPYWRMGNNKCIPSLDDVLNVFKYYANTFSSADERVSNAISVAVRNQISLNYYLDFDTHKDVILGSDEINTRWFPMGLDRVTIKSPPEHPVTIYSFKPFVELFTKTMFFDLYNESSEFVANKEFERFLADPQFSPIPVIIDQDQSILRHLNDGTVQACDCSTVTLKPSETCEENATLCMHTLPPFKALVSYVNNSRLYPDTPNDCTLPKDIDDISDDYSESCTIFTKRNADGMLVFDHFEGCSSGNDVDDNAIKCVMEKIINRIDKELLSGPVKKNVASAYWGAHVEGWTNISSSNSLKRVSCDGGVGNSGEYAGECINNLIDGKLNYKPPYGYVNLYPTSFPDKVLSGDLNGLYGYINITFAEPEYVDTIIAYMPHGYRQPLGFLGSLDGTHWMYLGTMNKVLSSKTTLKIAPVKIKYLAVVNTQTMNHDSIAKLIEIQVLSSVNFKYLINEFNLTYNGVVNTNSIEYNGTDINTGHGMATNAPPFVSPEPESCSAATCENTDYCSNFTGEKCPCCGEGIGGPGLVCCDTPYADSSVSGTCVDNNSNCHGKVNLALNTTSVYEGDWVRANVTGFCGDCEGRNVTIKNGTDFLCNATILPDGSGNCSFQVKDWVSSGSSSITITAHSPDESSSTDSESLQVTSCGRENEPACHYDWANNMGKGCYDIYLVNESGTCVHCGNVGEPSCIYDGEYSYDELFFGHTGSSTNCYSSTQDSSSDCRWCKPFSDHCNQSNKNSSDYCVSCGGHGEEQCTFGLPAGCDTSGKTDVYGRCDSGLIETGGHCCNSGETWDSSSSSCVTCGGDGQPCCDGGESCSAVIPSGSGEYFKCNAGAYCDVDTGDCHTQSCCNATTNTCYECGDEGEPCCNDGGYSNYCNSNTLGCASDGTCQRCNQYCTVTWSTKCACDGSSCPWFCAGSTNQCSDTKCISPDDSGGSRDYKCCLGTCSSSWSCSSNCTMCGNEGDNPL